MSRIVSVAIIVCAFSLSNCREKTDEHTVPQVAVNIDIDITLAQYNNLNFIGGWVYLNGGYNGLLVYRATLEDMKAYDRQAPYKVADHCQVEVDSVGIACFDPCSGSEWLMHDGQLLTGPALYPLREYNASFDGRLLTIRN